MVKRGTFRGEDDILRRKPGEGRDFFSHHTLGTIMDEETTGIRNMVDQVRSEPDPPPESIFELIYPPFPEVTERPASGQTVISYAGAIRSAIDHIIEDHNGVLWGQDVGRLGGVMTATAGLKAKHPERIIDAPLNEPLILGTACGAGLHGRLAHPARDPVRRLFAQCVPLAGAHGQHLLVVGRQLQVRDDLAYAGPTRSRAAPSTIR